ncbi:glycosyltransferase family 2 protein [Candidatus Pelagibacter sp.]|nr:glycosyltransferase family 2 protein [Candidatus Pelagibacter sp.]
MKLTIIIPVYNEINSINILLDKVLNTKIDKQIIVVDDNSSDGTREEILKNYKKKIDKLLLHEENRGKGAAIITAKKYINGDFVIIQDADLEYDPSQYELFINEVSKKKIDAIYGSRVLKKDKYNNIQNFSHKIRIWGNIFLTFISNKINNQKLTDAHTCYKMVRSDIFKSINLIETGFAFCPELNTKLSKLGIKIHEIPINYNGRTYEDGKKIRAIDGIIAIKTLIKYKFFH